MSEGTQRMRYIVGIDTGGTFTDCVAIDDAGTVTLGKVPSSTGSSQSVLDALEAVAQQLELKLGDFLQQVTVLAHGVTVGLNALLMRRGAKTGLITTAGHGDAILIGRAHQKTAGLGESELTFPARFSKPEPLVPRDRIVEVNERVDYKGAVLVPLAEEEARRAVAKLVAQGVQAIAISLLWSFKMPEHELLLRELIEQQHPEIFVTVSSELVPVIGEYERTATTVINSYIGPTMLTYFEGLTKQLQAAGLRSTPLIMQSAGGVLTSTQAARTSVRTLNSGPIGGVIAAKHLGELLGLENVITTDMGGTSFDVGLIARGQALYAREPVIDKYNLAIPTIDIRSIGAGGGSIAWVEPDNGVLHVGPDGAGAIPGPACYGKGGARPTVTDADLVLGYLNPDFFLGGRMKLYPEKARQAIREHICAYTKQSVEEAAAAIFRIVNSHMADLIRKSTVEKGYLPSQFSLFLFGGAGPVHGVAFGSDLGARGMVVPAMAAAFSALGIASCDVLQTCSRSDPMPLPVAAGTVNKILDSLRHTAVDGLRSGELGAGEITVVPLVSMRYRRQIHNEVWLTLPEGTLTTEDLERIHEAFKVRYEELYGKGSAYEQAGKEIVTFRVDAYGRTHKPKLIRSVCGDTDSSGAVKHERSIFFQGPGFIPTPVYDYGRLSPGNKVPGPAVIEGPTTTVVIPPQREGNLDGYRNIIIE